MQVHSVTSAARSRDASLMRQVFKHRIRLFQTAPALLAMLAVLVTCALVVSFTGQKSAPNSELERSAPEMERPVTAPDVEGVEEVVAVLNAGWKRIFAAQFLQAYNPVRGDLCAVIPKGLCESQGLGVVDIERRDVALLGGAAQHVAQILSADRSADPYISACLAGVWVRQNQLPSGQGNPMLVEQTLVQVAPLSVGREKHRRAFMSGYRMAQVFDCRAFGD